MTLNGAHKAFRAQEVRIDIALLAQPFAQHLFRQQPHMVSQGVCLLIAIEALQLRMLRGQLFDPAPEGMHLCISRTVNKADRPFRGQRRLQHRQRRCDAHPAADQHQRFFAGSQGELTCRRKQLNDVTHLQAVMQVVRHHTARLAFDADPVATHFGQRRQRIVATHFLAIDVELDADVLAGLKLKDRLLIHRAEVERSDFCAFF